MQSDSQSSQENLLVATSDVKISDGMRGQKSEVYKQVMQEAGRLKRNNKGSVSVA